MEGLIIRTALPTDIAKLQVFEQGVISAERPFDDTFKTEKIHYYDLDSLISDENVELVVAQVNDELIACGYAKILKTKAYVKYPFYSYLGFMYVAPEYRGQGINQQVIDTLAKWSQEQGINNMHLDVFADNESAVKAYRKSGFSQYLLEMRVDLAKEQQ